MNGFESHTNDPAGVAPGSATNAPGAASTATDPYTGTGYTGQTYTAPGTGGYTAPGTGGYTAPGYAASASMPPSPGLPNPALATFLGFIPGVGAMYNGQFAKGLAHIVIFAVLVSLSDHVNGIFGLLVAGWIFYMVFDAYQTARARRDGLQAPDPFGLNNIGERIGVGSGPNWSDFTAKPAPGQTAAYQAGSTAVPPYTPPYVPPTYVPPTYAPPVSSADPAYSQAYAEPSGYAAASAAPPAGSSVPPPAAPFGGTYAATYAPPPLPPLANGMPVGAFWLIGFGVLALAGTLSHSFSWSNRYLDGIIVALVGVALLVSRLLRARTVYPEGTPAAAWYLMHSARVGLLLLALGVALTLDHTGVLGWAYLWPYLLILLGVFLLLERALHNRMLLAEPVLPATPGSEPAPVATQTTGTGFVPNVSAYDEEGR